MMIKLTTMSLLCAYGALHSYLAYAGGIDQTEIELGTSLSLLRYTETLHDEKTNQDHFFMRDTGRFIGLNGAVSYYGDVFLRFESSVQAGRMSYDSARTGKTQGVTDTVWDTRAMVGPNFLYQCYRITPYIGMGFRYLFDNSYNDGQPTDTGYYGYDREANYIYSPLGIEIQRPWNHLWTVGVVAELDIFWHGFQETHLEQIDQTESSLVNKQNTGIGARASIRAIRCLCSGRKLVIEPYYRYWKIDESQVAFSVTNTSPPYIVSGTEPDNTTHEYGVALAMQF